MPSVSFRVNPEYADVTEIVPGLFVCGVSALTLQCMEKLNITLIINATEEVPNFASLGAIPRIKLWIEDTSQAYILPHFDNICDRIHAELTDNGKVLIHCVAGVSRSATLCLAYLTKYKCRSLREAYHLMASKRPMVRPVVGFWKQLISFEQEVKKAPATVKLISDESQSEKLLPDVYLKHIFPARSEGPNAGKDEKYENKAVGGKRKFQPVLETLAETTEMVTTIPSSVCPLKNPGF
ncbi:unnamed protein product [Enterobius vermicularis]|uniref:Protein-tyrosine-phosphatase n=1 Tax=Enterobius vermicularis TaxID=51028 RepID=A0A0N4USG6_ENTVE|nr:unnamed protein product [Enterobius vermicularis]